MFLLVALFQRKDHPHTWSVRVEIIPNLSFHLIFYFIILILFIIFVKYLFTYLKTIFFKFFMIYAFISITYRPIYEFFVVFIFTILAVFFLEISFFLRNPFFFYYFIYPIKSFEIFVPMIF